MIISGPPSDQAWHGSMLAYRSPMQSALDGLAATPMQDDWRMALMFCSEPRLKRAVSARFRAMALRSSDF
jgi:hypothetical protein